MPLCLDVYAARLPEVGTPPRHAFLLCEVAGQRPALSVPPPAPDAPPTSGGASPRAQHPHGDRAPLCMALVIDASGSMRGARFAIAVQAARDLIDSLSPSDRALIVTFERSARVVVGPLSGDGDGKAAARQALDRLATGAGTNLAGGWREASDALNRQMMPGVAKRIVLLTDGLPSVGERDPAALKRMVEAGRSKGIETSVVGIGDGIDDALCASLALAGDGRFHYLGDEGMVGSVVAGEIEGARRLAATDVALVLAFSLRVQRAEVMHRFPCRPDGRTLEVAVGAVSYEGPRLILLQVELEDPEHEAILGAAVARGRAVIARKAEPTSMGYALGARSSEDPKEVDNEAVSGRVSISLAAGPGPDESRKRIARAVLGLRTTAEVRGAWDAFDRRDATAIKRRLGRARDLRNALEGAGLLDAEARASVPDVDAIEAALLGPSGPELYEARRRFTSHEHNTMNSQIFLSVPRKALEPVE